MWRLSRRASPLERNLRSRRSSFRTAAASHTRNDVSDVSDRQQQQQQRRRMGHAVSLQLDYYLSPQFAGVASALANGGYASRGLDVSLLPTCPPGYEQARVRERQDHDDATVTLGTAEQNIFVPTLASNRSLRTTAVAAMFGESPLCIASLKDPSSLSSEDMWKIGTHEDTVELMERVFPAHEAVSSPRATKNTDLSNHKFDAIQAYTTTEVPALRRKLGREPFVTKMEGLGGAKLGYSQVIFAADECLEGDRRSVVRAFLEATFEGWFDAVRDPEEAVKMVNEAKKMFPDICDESNDHWHTSAGFDSEMLEACNGYVKGTFRGDRYGVIDADRWSEANDWLLRGTKGADGTPPARVPPNFGFDTEVWQPPANILGGNKLARKIMEDAKASAASFQETHGRKPSLAVVTVGELKRYEHGERRREIYGSRSCSWFSKTDTGSANGFDVREIHLDAETVTTDELLSVIYKLRDEVDGIQLMRPLPDRINAAEIYSAIPLARDVDGGHYVGQLELGNKNAYPPVTPAAVLALMDEHGVSAKGKRVLVVGRSPIVGSPVARMLRDRGGAVTVAHTDVDAETLEKLVNDAEILVCCAGAPGSVKAEWIAEGAVAINVGTTFDVEKDGLVSDVGGDIASSRAAKYSPVPGGVGPISAPMLFKNVVEAAWNRAASSEGAALDTGGWVRKPARLEKAYSFDTYGEALDACKKVDDLSTVMDHHANMKLTHKCTDGVDVEMEFFTYEAGAVTEKDYEAANAVDMALSKGQVEMSKYSYDLQESSIAKYPARPRGSSKMLRVDPSGRVTYHENFSEAFPALAKGAHVVFNDSRVLDARLFVKGGDDGSSEVELMILDLGSIDVRGTCEATPLHAMIRSSDVKVGDLFEESKGNGFVEVLEIKGIWEEDEKSDGNGMECLVKIKSNDSVERFLETAGSVPIPPYLHRREETSDKEAYNNTYAANAGSVAAPTAGLHFTDKVLDEIGAGNCSYLSLHVGAGTFKPVLVQDARDHAMHAETFTVPVKELRDIVAALKADKPLIVVGTTSSRTLESLFWCGVKRLRGLDGGSNSDGGLLTLGQFDWVPLSVGDGRNVSRVAAFEALIEGLDDNDALAGRTSLMIAPPFYKFRVVDHLVTNFHAPDSTLMLLVSAFIKDARGDKISSIYENAQENGYRFLSFGDVCMFSRPGPS